MTEQKQGGDEKRPESIEKNYRSGNKNLRCLSMGV